MGWRDFLCVPPTSHPQRIGEESGGEGEDGTRCIQDKKRSLLGTGLISGKVAGEGGTTRAAGGRSVTIMTAGPWRQRATARPAAASPVPGV